jgi:hypothetical protein
VPSTSEKQKKFMDAAAHNPAFAKAAGVPQKVAKEFSDTSKGMTFKGGPKRRPDLQKFNAPETRHGKTQMFKEGGDTMANTTRMNRLEELGRVNAEKASTAKGKSNLNAEKKRVIGELKMAKGGISTSLKAHAAAPASKAHAGMKTGGMTKMGAVKTSSKPDGVISKGKTKGMQVAMKRGGKC